jgi:hypothetical protein
VDLDEILCGGDNVEDYLDALFLTPYLQPLQNGELLKWIEGKPLISSE